MIQRIRNLISAKNLTASAFADRIGVPRSTISHILSGRNKPSLELVQKILDAFPDLRVEWIIRGKGRMISEDLDLFSNAPAISSDPDMEEEGAHTDQTVETDNKEVPADQVAGPSVRRDITRLIAIYNDGSFSEYYPSE